MRTLVQTQLKQDDRLMTTWLDKDTRIKEGSVLSLKDVDGKWAVVKLYDKEIESADLDRQRNFDNNNYDKHKGLGV